MTMRVLKFGGTSVQDASALSRVRAIVAGRVAFARPLVVVLSATSGTTDALLRAARSFDVDAVAALRARHHAIVDELVPAAEAHHDVDALCDALATYVRGMRLLKECTDRSLDEVASFGERLSTTIFAHACTAHGLRAVWQDARAVMRTDATHGAAAVDMAAVRHACLDVIMPRTPSADVIVTQGFIGATADGITTTLGRGGSDYSAAILGAAMQAEAIEIWTDVSGIYTTDPRIAPTARPIPQMGFAEVRDLALHGAKVLHPDTIAPAVDAGIPVHVLNTFAPEQGGTVITAEAPDDATLHAVSVLRDCLLVQWRGQATSPFRDSVLQWSYRDGAACVLRVASEPERLDADVMMADLRHTSRDVAVVTACGPRASSPEAVAAIASAVSNHRIHAIVAGVSHTTCFVVCDVADATSVLQDVHAVIVQS